MSIQPGQSLLHYSLVEKIGAGGMGVVWKAVDSTLDREVAIKILPDGVRLATGTGSPIRARDQTPGVAQ